MDTSRIIEILIPLSLTLAFLVLLVNGLKSLINILLKAEKSKLYLLIKNFFFFLYISFGIVIFTIIPQYFSENYNYQKYGKFSFILDVKRIDYAMMGFEVLGYILLGLATYFFLYKLCKSNKEI